jgi:hypothetical protein
MVPRGPADPNEKPRAAGPGVDGITVSSQGYFFSARIAACAAARRAIGTRKGEQET